MTRHLISGRLSSSQPQWEGEGRELAVGSGGRITYQKHVSYITCIFTSHDHDVMLVYVYVCVYMYACNECTCTCT